MQSYIYIYIDIKKRWLTNSFTVDDIIDVYMISFQRNL